MKSKKAIIKENFKLWQILLGLIHNHKCQVCGAEGSCGHHLYNKRGIDRTAWTIKNGIYLCVKCHRFAHDNPMLFERILSERNLWDDDTSQEMNMKAFTSIKMPIEFYEARNKRMKEMIEEL